MYLCVCVPGTSICFGCAVTDLHLAYLNTPSSYSSGSSYTSTYSSYYGRDEPTTPGLVGLMNLGNTYAPEHTHTRNTFDIQTHTSYNSYNTPYGIRANYLRSCFMNSGLQCISHCGLLADFFLNGTYKEQINRTNKLGMKGLLAQEYAKLVEGTLSTVSCVLMCVCVDC